MKNISKVLLMVLGLAFLPLAAVADTPIKGGGPFGLGLEFGDPGTWGAVGKFWVDHNSAFQPAVKLGNGAALLQCDYLYHQYDVIHPSQGLLPLYFGAGADLSLQTNIVIGARGVVGISYMFDRVNIPVDIYVQVVPELWIYTIAGGGTSFQVYGNIGSRYYF